LERCLRAATIVACKKLAETTGLSEALVDRLIIERVATHDRPGQHGCAGNVHT